MAEGRAPAPLAQVLRAEAWEPLGLLPERVPAQPQPARAVRAPVRVGLRADLVAVRALPPVLLLGRVVLVRVVRAGREHKRRRRNAEVLA